MSPAPPEREGQSSKRATRRTILRGAAVPLALSLAGCGSRRGDATEPVPLSDVIPDLPVEQRGDVLEAGIAAGLSTASSDLDSFESALTEAGASVETVDGSDGTLDVEYMADWSDGLLYGVGLVGGAYASLVRGGYPATELRATILDADGRPFGEFTANIDWVRRLNGDLTKSEYGTLVADTLETVA